MATPSAVFDLDVADVGHPADGGSSVPPMEPDSAVPVWTLESVESGESPLASPESAHPKPRFRLQIGADGSPVLDSVSLRSTLKPPLAVAFLPPLLADEEEEEEEEADESDQQTTTQHAYAHDGNADAGVARSPTGASSPSFALDRRASYEVTSEGIFRTDMYELRKTGFKRRTLFADKLRGASDLQVGLSNRRVEFSKLSSSSLEQMGILGRGASGQVTKSLHVPTMTVVALKSIDVGAKGRRAQFVHELFELDTLDCPQIVCFYGAYYEEGHVFLALEFMDRGAMDSILRTLSTGGIPGARRRHSPSSPLPPNQRLHEKVVSSAIKQILLGVRYLHASNKLHRDIKPGNMLCNHLGEVKLSDFGLTSSVEAARGRDSFVGTTIYMSPERITGGEYSLPSDIWSVGMSLVYMLTGEPPVSTADGYWGIVMSINEDFDPKLDPHTYSKEVRDFVAKCLCKKPADRWTAEQLLAHPFIVNGPTSLESCLAYWPKELNMGAATIGVDADYSKYVKSWQFRNLTRDASMKLRRQGQRGTILTHKVYLDGDNIDDDEPDGIAINTQAELHAHAAIHTAEPDSPNQRRTHERILRRKNTRDESLIGSYAASLKLDAARTKMTRGANHIGVPEDDEPNGEEERNTCDRRRVGFALPSVNVGSPSRSPYGMSPYGLDATSPSGRRSPIPRGSTIHIADVLYPSSPVAMSPTFLYSDTPDVRSEQTSPRIGVRSPHHQADMTSDIFPPPLIPQVSLSDAASASSAGSNPSSALASPITPHAAISARSHANQRSNSTSPVRPSTDLPADAAPLPSPSPSPSPSPRAGRIRPPRLGLSHDFTGMGALPPRGAPTPTPPLRATSTPRPARTHRHSRIENGNLVVIERNSAAVGRSTPVCFDSDFVLPSTPLSLPPLSDSTIVSVTPLSQSRNAITPRRTESSASTPRSSTDRSNRNVSLHSARTAIDDELVLSSLPPHLRAERDRQRERSARDAAAVTVTSTPTPVTPAGTEHVNESKPSNTACIIDSEAASCSYASPTNQTPAKSILEQETPTTGQRQHAADPSPYTLVASSTAPLSKRLPVLAALSHREPPELELPAAAQPTNATDTDTPIPVHTHTPIHAPTTLPELDPMRVPSLTHTPTSAPGSPVQLSSPPAHRSAMTVTMARVTSIDADTSPTASPSYGATVACVSSPVRIGVSTRAPPIGAVTPPVGSTPPLTLMPLASRGAACADKRLEPNSRLPKLKIPYHAGSADTRSAPHTHMHGCDAVDAASMPTRSPSLIASVSVPASFESVESRPRPNALLSSSHSLSSLPSPTMSQTSVTSHHHRTHRRGPSDPGADTPRNKTQPRQTEDTQTKRTKAKRHDGGATIMTNDRMHKSTRLTGSRPSPLTPSSSLAALRPPSVLSNSISLFGSRVCAFSFDGQSASRPNLHRPSSTLSVSAAQCHAGLAAPTPSQQSLQLALKASQLRAPKSSASGKKGAPAYHTFIGAYTFSPTANTGDTTIANATGVASPLASPHTNQANRTRKQTTMHPIPSNSANNDNTVFSRIRAQSDVGRYDSVASHCESVPAVVAPPASAATVSVSVTGTRLDDRRPSKSRLPHRAPIATTLFSGEREQTKHRHTHTSTTAPSDATPTGAASHSGDVHVGKLHRLGAFGVSRSGATTAALPLTSVASPKLTSVIVSHAAHAHARHAAPNMPPPHHAAATPLAALDAIDGDTLAGPASLDPHSHAHAHASVSESPAHGRVSALLARVGSSSSLFGGLLDRDDRCANDLTASMKYRAAKKKKKATATATATARDTRIRTATGTDTVTTTAADTASRMQ